MEPKFHIGDRVIGIKEVDDLDIVGQVGTIVSYTDRYGVEFDKAFAYSLHSLGGDITGDRGWWCDEWALELYEDPLAYEYENVPDVTALL